MKENGKPLPESNTYYERFWLNNLKPVETSEQEYNYLTPSRRRPSTPYSRKTHEVFPRHPVTCFCEVDKTRTDIFDILPRFFKNLLESEDILCSATARTKTALDFLHLGPISHGIFFKRLGMHFSRDTNEGNDPVVCAFPFCFSFCVWEWSPQFANSSVFFPSSWPLQTHELFK